MRKIKKLKSRSDSHQFETIHPGANKSTAWKQAALSNWQNVELDSLFKHPSYPCTKCVTGKRRWKGHSGGNRQQGGDPGLNNSGGGWLDIVRLALNERLAKKRDRVPLSSTDGLIEDLEDDNRLDRGLCAVPVRFKLRGRPGLPESKLI